MNLIINIENKLDDDIWYTKNNYLKKITLGISINYLGICYYSAINNKKHTNK